jgi:hypothetical protein
MSARVDNPHLASERRPSATEEMFAFVVFVLEERYRSRGFRQPVHLGEAATEGFAYLPILWIGYSTGVSSMTGISRSVFFS